MGQKSKREGRADMAYRYNTLFKSWFLIRMLAFTIGGLVYLVIATNNNGPVDYFCTRYYDVDENDFHLAEQGNDLSEQEVELCRDEIRTAGWLFYFPMVVFQVHCLYIMNKYRETIENKDYQSKFVAEEDI